jgi:uncharacterized protein (TIRG00374 family)
VKPDQFRFRTVRLIRAAWGNKWFRGAANTAFGLVALYLVFRSVPIGQVVQHTDPRHLSPLIAIVVLTVLSQVVRAGRFALLLRGWVKVGLLEALWVNASTQLVNYAIPVRAGEGLRLWWLVKRQGQAAALGLGLIVVDHTFDLAGVAAVLGAGAVLRWTSMDTRLPSLPALVAVLAAALLTLVAIAGGLVVGPRLVCSRPLSRFVRCSWRESLERQGAAFRSGLRETRGRRLGGVVAMTALAVFLDGLAFAMLFRALGLAVPLASAIVAQVTLLYTYLLPAAPGYVGSLEAAGTFLLSSLGLSHPAATGAILLWHGLLTFIILALGALAMYRLLRVRTARPSRIVRVWEALRLTRPGTPPAA